MQEEENDWKEYSEDEDEFEEEDDSGNEELPESDEKENYLEDEESDEDDELISEMSEERGGYVYLRYRDSKGRFTSEFRDPERTLYLEMDRKIKKFCREYDRKIQLPFNEKVLLLRLVDDFRERKHFYKDKDGIETDDPFFPLSQFKRLLYHEVLKDCKMKRSAFSLFINRMVEKGLIVKYKVGKKLYLKITKEGLDKAYAFWEEYPGETWRFP